MIMLILLLLIRMIQKRPPNLKEAYSKLIKLVGKEYADNLVKTNQNKLISKTKLHL